LIFNIGAAHSRVINFEVRTVPIGSVREQSSSIIVYDEKGRTLFTKPRGSRSGDGLKGYTATTVSIRAGSSINTYDDRGRTLFSKPA
jgi:hypothetical protein